MEDVSLPVIAWRAAVIFLLVAANAFFVAAEYALVASRRTRIEAWVRRGDRKARLLQKAVQSINRYISGAQLGVTAASLGLGWVGEPMLARGINQAFRALPSPADVIATHTVAVTIAFLMLTFLLIVLSELVPKAVVLLYPEKTGRWVAGPLIAFTEATNPFIYMLNGSANALLRLFRIRPPAESERVHQPEEIVMLARQSQRAGSLDREDVRMIEGVFEFTEKNAREVMTPRTEVIALPASLTVGEAADRIGRVGRSRYPVYAESVDDIVGIVHVKQILAALPEHGGRPVTSIMREPLFVPGTREVEDVLADLKRLKSQMAIVLDEYGGTAGLITMEDLLEEIVGEIYDEYDRAEPEPLAQGDHVMLPGEMEIDDVNQRYGLAVSDAEYQTIGGYVFGQLGRLPRVGDRVRASKALLEVQEMDGRRVARLKMVTQA